MARRFSIFEWPDRQGWRLHPSLCPGQLCSGLFELPSHMPPAAAALSGAAAALAAATIAATSLAVAAA